MRHEGGLQHQVLRLVADEEELGQRHQVGPGLARRRGAPPAPWPCCRRCRPRRGRAAPWSVGTCRPSAPPASLPPPAYSPPAATDKGGRPRTPAPTKAIVAGRTRLSKVVPLSPGRPRGASEDAQGRANATRGGQVKQGAGIWTAMALAALAPAAALAQEQVLTKEYDNGGVYEGTFVDGRQQGQGTYRLPNGYEYTGDVGRGPHRGPGPGHLPERLGLRRRTSSPASPTARARSPIPTAAATRATGRRAASRARASPSTPTAPATRAASSPASRSGEGTLTEPDGSSYAGGWVDGVKQGKGKITYPDGTTYEGDMADGAARGPRQARRPPTAPRYEGGWKAGKFEGDGVLVQARRRPLRGRLRRRPPRGARARHHRRRRRLRRRLRRRPAQRRRHADRRRRLPLHRRLGRGPLRGRGQGHLSRRLGLRGRLQGRPAATGSGKIIYADGTQLRGRLGGGRDLRPGHRATTPTA